jgi:CRISPR-associated protein Cmr3
MICLSVISCDPLIARDGRPSVEGLRMKSLRWPYPSVLAGSLRTLLGKEAGGAFSPEQVKDLKEIVVAGPLPFAGGQLFFPAPKDVALDPASRTCFGARPRTPDGGGRCNLPTGLDPVLLPENLVEDFKPAPLPAFWSCERMSEWVLNAKGRGFEILHQVLGQ